MYGRRKGVKRIKKEIEEDAKKVQDVVDAVMGKTEEVPIHDSVEEVVNSQVKEEIAKVTETNFTCPICSELFIEPMTADCGHTFCSFCINKWRGTQNSCPTCRNRVITLGKTVVIENFLDSMVKKMSQEDQEKRMEVIKERSLTKKAVISKRRNVRQVIDEYGPVTILSMYPFVASQSSTSQNVHDVSYHLNLPESYAVNPLASISSSRNIQDSANAQIEPPTYLSRIADDTNSRNEQMSNLPSGRSRFQIESILRPRTSSHLHMRALHLRSRNEHGDIYYETRFHIPSGNSNSRNEHTGPVPLHRSRSPLP